MRHRANANSYGTTSIACCYLRLEQLHIALAGNVDIYMLHTQLVSPDWQV
jgi:hypothetical protein